MTIEEAIKTFKGRKALAFADGYADQVQDYIEATDMAITALREKQERENPRPLTVDELLEMDGQPVWVVFSKNYVPVTHEYVPPQWMLVNEKENMLETGNEFVDFGDNGWAAYRYPPKQAGGKYDSKHRETRITGRYFRGRNSVFPGARML